MAKPAGGLMTLLLVFLGAVVMATPLALWVAWTQTMLLIVLGTGVTAGVLYCVLVGFEKPAERGEGSGGTGFVTLPDKVIEDLQRLHPFVHHHRPTGGPTFRTTMSLLKKRLYRERGRPEPKATRRL